MYTSGKFKNFPEIEQIAEDLLADLEVPLDDNNLSTVIEALSLAAQLGVDHGWWLLQEEDDQ
jgi:hypothetical protein